MFSRLQFWSVRNSLQFSISSHWKLSRIENTAKNLTGVVALCNGKKHNYLAYPRSAYHGLVHVFHITMKVSSKLCFGELK